MATLSFQNLDKATILSIDLLPNYEYNFREALRMI